MTVWKINKKFFKRFILLAHIELVAVFPEIFFTILNFFIFWHGM
jgi:hypothetical protein